jgi:hypothetical protein
MGRAYTKESRNSENSSPGAQEKPVNSSVYRTFLPVNSSV